MQIQKAVFGASGVRSRTWRQRSALAASLEAGSVSPFLLSQSQVPTMTSRIRQLVSPANPQVNTRAGSGSLA